MLAVPITLCAVAGAAGGGAAETHGIAWGPQNFGGPCPIVYPFRNETRFCKSVGRQRAVVAVDEAAAARAGGVACADIEWRRRDDPATRGVLVLGAAANVSASALQTVADFPPSSVLRPNATVGTVCFRADGHSGRYAVYWLPFA